VGRGIKDDTDTPIIIPKLGDLVSLEIMMETLISAKLDLQTYFALKQKAVANIPNNVH